MQLDLSKARLDALKIVVYEADGVVPRCSYDTAGDCDLPAEWIVWEHGRQHATKRYVCAGHCPPCSEERGGKCKEGHELSGLAAALYAMHIELTSQSEREEG